MSGAFEVEIATPLTPEQAWGRLWDLERHSGVIPLTAVATDPPAMSLDVGVRLRARTALGPVGFDDEMVVMAWGPPPATVVGGRAVGRAVVDKVGVVLGGRIEVTVSPFAGGGSRIIWRQQVLLPWLPRRLSGAERLAARALAPGYRSVLRRLLA